MHEGKRRAYWALLTLACVAALFVVHAADKRVEAWFVCSATYSAPVLPTLPPDHDAPRMQSTRTKLDLNTADAWMLTAIPGVGSVLAERVIEYRAENGGFLDVRELLRVQGIGEKLFAVMCEYVEVSPSAP